MYKDVELYNSEGITNDEYRSELLFDKRHTRDTSLWMNKFYWGHFYHSHYLWMEK